MYVFVLYVAMFPVPCIDVCMFEKFRSLCNTRTFLTSPDDTVGDRLVTDDQPSDLDSLAAAKIDNRFKEIMSRKKGKGLIASSFSM